MILCWDKEVFDFFIGINRLWIIYLKLDIEWILDYKVVSGCFFVIFYFVLLLVVCFGVVGI